ncbi:MAG: hypothetical protein P8X74_08100 [Reinekea sp.]
MLPKNRGEPMGAPAIFEKQREIKLLPPASTLESRIQVLFKILHQDVRHFNFSMPKVVCHRSWLIESKKNSPSHVA